MCVGVGVCVCKLMSKQNFDILYMPERQRTASTTGLTYIQDSKLSQSQTQKYIYICEEPPHLLILFTGPCTYEYMHIHILKFKQ